MKQTEIEKVAAQRIRALHKLHENPTPELEAEFEALNQRMNELCPRVTPGHWEMLERTQKALERASVAMSELDKLIQGKDYLVILDGEVNKECGEDPPN
jgi:hypothetical protein